MGLDTYASRSNDENGSLTDEDKQAFLDADIHLCGGMFSGNGNDGSFRGKVYSQIVEDITNASLYSEWIDSDEVARMSECIDDYLADIEQLARFFTVCRERGLGLKGWW